MMLDEGKIVAAAALFSVVGIALLLFMAETPQQASVAQALLSGQNALVRIYGTAANVTSEKFLLCDPLCISVRSNDLPSARLLADGRQASVVGRMKDYMGRKYVEAESIEVG